MSMRLRKIIILSFAFIQCFSFSGFATDETVTMKDITITQAEFEALEHSYAEYEVDSARATGLITAKSLGIAKSGSNLVITGKTTGSSTVTKCGFESLTIERRLNSNSSWSEFASFSNLYDSDASYVLKKSVEVDSGYQYRVVGEHRAYEGWFTYESAEAETGYIQL